MHQRIEKWIDTFMANRASERDDVHIDQLDDKYHSAETWLDGALAALASAAAIVNERELSVTVAVELFMREGDKPGTLQLHSLEDLSSSSFSWTPPSLTIYRRGSEPWRHENRYVPIQLSRGSQAPPWKRALFQEWFDEAEGNYDRRLWLVAA